VSLSVLTATPFCNSFSVSLIKVTSSVHCTRAVALIWPVAKFAMGLPAENVQLITPPSPQLAGLTPGLAAHGSTSLGPVPRTARAVRWAVTVMVWPAGGAARVDA
jgi:hypothetical protein